MAKTITLTKAQRTLLAEAVAAGGRGLVVYGRRMIAVDNLAKWSLVRANWVIEGYVRGYRGPTRWRGIVYATESGKAKHRELSRR